MAQVIKKSDVVKMLPKRDPLSHKGQNGRVLVIGGSLDYFGAPILAGLGALGGGADLVYLLAPECNFDVSRSFYPDFIVRKYSGNFINDSTVEAAEFLLQKVDSVLIGPGISENKESLSVIKKIIERTNCPVVLDAEAIPVIAQFGLPQTTSGNESRFTITPHPGEMDEITEGALPEDFEELIKVVEDFAHKWKITILLKGPRSVVASPSKPTRVNETGNAGMTVGGSGDVLAGFTTSLIAQKCPAYEACQCAAFLLGAAGDNLYQQKGYGLIATDLAQELPYTIHGITG